MLPLRASAKNAERKRTREDVMGEKAILFVWMGIPEEKHTTGL
jgi:hypothetical protein